MKISGIGLQKLLMSLGLPASNKQVVNRFCGSSEERLMGRLELMTVMDLSTITPEEGNYLSHGANDGDMLKISQYRVLDSWNLAELADQVTANRRVVQAHLDR
jgi:hypothetical protein